MIRYTQKQRDILNFIDRYGFITAKICGNIFYKGNKYGLTQARDTLTKMVKNKDVVTSIQEFSREKFFQLSKKIISKHDYYILNFYGEMNLIVDKIDEFKLEQHWLGGARRSDGLIVLSNTVNDIEYKRAYFIECDFTHRTDKNKYLEIFNSGDVQEYFNNNYGTPLFPDVIQIAFTDRPTISSNENFNVIGVDYTYSNLVSKILMA